MNTSGVAREDAVVRSQDMSNRFFFLYIVWFVRLLALRPLLAYCASLG
jgi:hypothetical protein